LEFKVAKKIEKLMPEGMHMLTWVMSDRAIPRSCGVRCIVTSRFNGLG
jgi:catalase